MTLHWGDLVLCSGSLAPDVPLRERIEATAAAGFAGISLWGRDYARARAAGLSDADIRVLLRDHGLSVAELDGAWAWLPGADRVQIPEAADTEQFFRHREDDLFRLADTVGARSINAVDVFGGDWTLADAAASFAGLCDRAAEHGLLVHLEFLPWSRIPNLSSAWEVVRTAGRANGGLVIDSWHFFRSDADWDMLQSVPGESVLGVQLSDAPVAAEDNLVDATLHHRRLPGDGAFDLARLVRALAAIGAAAPIGVEVFSDALHALPAAEAARRCASATRQVLGVLA
jgi:sugar phosphate isomerase/epimerase